MGTLTIESPLGPLKLTSRDGRLVSLSWGRAGEEAPDEVLTAAAAQLSEYFAGRRTVFDLPLDGEGSAFRRRVWAALAAIPYGRTVRYGDLALDLATAPRAIGGACAANPIPIIVPCHRVVGGSGLAGGYSGDGGLTTKAWLLEHERRHAFL